MRHWPVIWPDSFGDDRTAIWVAMSHGRATFLSGVLRVASFSRELRIKKEGRVTYDARIR